jgi:hypothetical protein|tara:strand:+ start:1475 stop:2167 length:693 start_codon:yes stop_codon:yes gene_type:complete
MSSPVDICNQALAHLGDRRITRLDDDAQTTDALVRYCSEFYDQARQETLAAQRWTFAKAASALSRRTDIATIGFNYSHQLPSDRIRLLHLVIGSELKDSEGVVTSISYGTQKVDKFKIVGQQVWSDQKYLAIEYIKDVNNPTEWSPHFRAAVARLLASYLAGPIADDPGAVAQQKRIYETVDLPNAQYYDAVQDGSGENSDSATRIAGSPLLQSRHRLNYGQSEQLDNNY